MGKKIKNLQKIIKNIPLWVWLTAIGVAFTLFSVWLWCMEFGDYNEIIRNWIFAIGALGAFYGLVLAKKRQDTFAIQVDKQTEQIAGLAEQIKTQKKQAETAEKQVANEMLVQGFSLLANDNITLRRSGIRVLEDLARTSPEYARQIFNVLMDYVKEKAQPKFEIGLEKTLAPAKPHQERIDVELAIAVFLNIHKEKDFAFKEIEIFFSGLDLREIYFWNLDLRDMNFSSSYLQGASFAGSKLYFANFKNAKLSRTGFYGAKLNGAHMDDADFGGHANLHQEGIDSVIFFDGHPPINLPEYIKKSYLNRAYDLKPIPDTQLAHMHFVDGTGADWQGEKVNEWIAKEIAEAEAKKGGD